MRRASIGDGERQPGDLVAAEALLPTRAEGFECRTPLVVWLITCRLAGIAGVTETVAVAHNGLVKPTHQTIFRYFNLSYTLYENG